MSNGRRGDSSMIIIAGMLKVAAVRPEVLDAEVYKHRVSESGPPFP